MDDYPFLISSKFRGDDDLTAAAARFENETPYAHCVIDDFLPENHARFLADRFPETDHPVWLDYRQRSEAQYGKQGPGDSSRFDTLDPGFRLALGEFNNSNFLQYIEAVTGIGKLLPDPYFGGGGVHQIIKGGVLDIHTDFNLYPRLDLYRQINVLIYLTEEWHEGYGGELELWNAPAGAGGAPVKTIAPQFNRCVIFRTNKTTFHGHPSPWRGPNGLCRRSIALYYYTAQPLDGQDYDGLTDFQGVARHEVEAG